MPVCTFFGHRECYGLNIEVLQGSIESLIMDGVDTFYLGHQGQYDRVVLSCLKNLVKIFPYIHYSVVLAYMPQKKAAYDPYADCSIFPEGLESVHPRFAIDWRNRWMLQHADFCLCYVNYTWGNAYKYARLAIKNGISVRNLGDVPFL